MDNAVVVIGGRLDFGKSLRSTSDESNLRIRSTAAAASLPLSARMDMALMCDPGQLSSMS